MTTSTTAAPLSIASPATLIPWTPQEAAELYGVERWGKGYFGVNAEGHVVVYPTKEPNRGIDLKKLVDQLAERDIFPPVLIRFTDILKHRIREVAEAFGEAIREHNYRNRYACVYPIKVNQQRHVVEEMRDFGSEHGFGLEAGSKPELLAVLAILGDMDMPVICNGFKDDEYIETVILAQKIGKRVIPVVEKFTELELIVKYAQLHNIQPSLGVRVKLSSRGSGRWEESGGVRSKFGLFMSEVIDALDYLKRRGMADSMKLVHCHLGSQITNIRGVKDAVTELARVYVGLKKSGAGLEMMDIGGGLGVDYDGTQTDNESSMNYTLQEYAADVIFRVGSICDEAEVEHPMILSESGRAMVAYHSALVFNVLGVSGFDEFKIPAELPPPGTDQEVPQPIHDLFHAHRDVSARNAVETYHDATAAYDQVLNLFNLGYLSVELRSLAEQLFWSTCSKIVALTRQMKRVPKELRKLPDTLLDTYFVNVSIFQSLPDSWAINQKFPIMPIHRLDEQPTRLGMLADVTCDSDGRIDHFIDVGKGKNALELHPFAGGDYTLAAFLVGAYQEILGDLHNLFGDTHAVHVSLDADGDPVLEHVIDGDTVREVLSYVQFNADELLSRMRREVERAIKAGKLTIGESAQLMRFYEKGLNGYTYLEEPHPD